MGRSRKWLVTAILAVVLLLPLASVVSADPGDGGFGFAAAATPPRHDGPQHIDKDREYSDDQDSDDQDSDDPDSDQDSDQDPDGGTLMLLADPGDGGFGN